MKRYWLFAGDFYAKGGWDDLQNDFDSEDDAISKGRLLIKAEGFSWWHVVDSAVGKIVRKSDYD